MHTVIISIKKSLLTAILLMAIGNGAIAQDSTKMARHFAGIYGGIDLSQTSTFTGVSYEYISFRGRGAELGVSFNYTFAYRGGNLIFLYEDDSEPRMASYGVGLTGYLFTNKQKNNNGFFVSGQLGVSGTGWLALPTFGNLLRPKGGLGFGWKWVMPKGKAIRWATGATYTGANSWQDAGFSANTTLSLGF